MNTTKSEEISHILSELQKTHYPSGSLYQIVQGYKALCNRDENELEAIYNLVEVHCPDLRRKTMLRYEKLWTNGCEDKTPSLSLFRNSIAFKCATYPVEQHVQQMLREVAEMPKEWTIVQLTPQYNPVEYLNVDNDVYHTNPIHMSVFRCGSDREKPFMITVDVPIDPVNGKKLELIQEMMSIISENKEALMSNAKQTRFRNTKEKWNYIGRRQLVEDRLKSLIKDVQDMWLKHWRCLLTGRYCDDNLEGQFQTEIYNYFKTECDEIELTDKTAAILCSVAKCKFLKLSEVKAAVQYCFPSIPDKEVMKIARFLRKLGDELLVNANRKKNPVILVLHDNLDCFPWELLDVLQDEPVSRLPSLHFVYCLFKEHEYDIVDGFKVITQYDKGTYIVNPDRDLRNMEIRMMSFFNYWTPEWTGTSGFLPDKDEFYELLTSSHVFSYNGHGGGGHLISTEKIQRTHVKAVVLLFGCGSTRLKRLDPQVEMFGSYHAYLIARCPCVVGMLWEVTDTETDVLTTDFMSYWIPSEAPIHWKYVDKAKWKKAEQDIQFVKNAKNMEEGKHWEPELQRALNLAKKSVTSLTIKAACVVRGLPVKID